MKTTKSQLKQIIKEEILEALTIMNDPHSDPEPKLFGKMDAGLALPDERRIESHFQDDVSTND